MKRLFSGLLAAVMIILGLLGTAAAADPPPASTVLPADPATQRAFFETKIRPVLVEHCYECHAADSKIVQGGLRVDHREGLRKRGDSGGGGPRKRGGEPAGEGPPL